jgi:hypothetical protein
MSRRLPISGIVVLLLVVLALGVAVTFREFFGSKLFVADGRNLVKNGSFESGNDQASPDEPKGGACKLLCDGSITVDGWKASGTGGPQGKTCSGSRAADAVCWGIGGDITVQEGTHLVDPTGFIGRPPAGYGTVSQAVATGVGRTYELSFWVGSSSRFPGEGLGVSVDISGVTSGFFPAPPPVKPSDWTETRFQFKAVSEMTTLSFTGAVSPGGKGSDYIGLDNVSLERVCFIVIARLYGCP